MRTGTTQSDPADKLTSRLVFGVADWTCIQVHRKLVDVHEALCTRWTVICFSILEKLVSSSTTTTGTATIGSCTTTTSSRSNGRSHISVVFTVIIPVFFFVFNFVPIVIITAYFGRPDVIVIV